jgi:hypothetical protein
MMIYNMSTSYLHKNLFHYLEDYLIKKQPYDKVVNIAPNPFQKIQLGFNYQSCFVFIS